ncbi:MAG: type II secretion system protein E [Lentisphaerae bacterium GWF2_44_16]|nr:MAG: type II secretion system protein E [Lentisphaerae bacterium GWF2_44_16]
MTENSDYILELLTEYGMLTEEQVEEGWKKVSESNGEHDIIDALKILGYVDEYEMMAMLAQHYGLETLDLEGYQIPLEIIETVPPDIAKRYNIVPVMKHDEVLTIAMSDPTDMETLDSLRYALKCDVEAVISPKEQIQKVIDQRYGSLSQSVESFIGEMDETGQIEAQMSGALDEEGAEQGDDAPIIKLVSLLIIEAFNKRASDIHLEPLEKRYRVRYRIDGVLKEMESPPKYLQPNITSRLKIMAKMDISEKRIPLDGRIQLKIGQKDIDLRVSSVPTTHGESIVMRILDKSSIQLDIPQLGFYSDDQELIDKVLALPEGVFLVTGPTGSGKTTSLYAFLNTMNSPHRKIITVEDPIEYQLSGINQVQVNHLINMTFAAALRSMLRQAPNVIMVGEIRDLETAETAINAALTGHLVFSTLHTNDAPSAVTRLIDMGVKPFLVASAVRAIMAQRLVRRICKKCIAPYIPEPKEIQLLKLSDEFIKKSTFMKGRGCAECGNSGYRGRVGIYEVFILSEEIQHMIYKKVTAGTIRDAARKSGMRTLREDALRKAAAGLTSLEEVIGATVQDEN